MDVSIRHRTTCRKVSTHVYAGKQMRRSVDVAVQKCSREPAGAKETRRMDAKLSSERLVDAGIGFQSMMQICPYRADDEPEESNTLCWKRTMQVEWKKNGAT